MPRYHSFQHRSQGTDANRKARTAEPIVITTFNRDEKTKSGTIKNIRFFNVTAKGENGVLIHGNEDNIKEANIFNRTAFCVFVTVKCSNYNRLGSAPPIRAKAPCFNNNI